MNVSRRGRPWAFTLPAIASAFLAIASILLAGCDPDQTAGRVENYVTVRLNDSLSRYDSVEILILADGDTNAVIGKAWDGRLAAPQEIPPYRLNDAETRTLSVRVKGYDQFGRLILDMLITKRNGTQVVTNMVLPKPSPALASLAVEPGSLSPAFDPAVKEYALALANDQTRLQVTMTPDYAQAIMSAGLVRAYAGKAAEPIDMRVGANRVVLNITAADTSTQYVINATRAQAPADTVKVPPDTVPQVNPFAAWKHMALISPDFTQVGMGFDAEVTDFPALLRLTRSNFNLSEAGENGKDIRFATQDHRVLPHETYSWDTRAGSARIWIKTDTLRGNTKTGSILMYWGNPSVASTSDPAKVFTVDAGWSGVWHLEEDGRGAAGEYKDATGRFHASASGKAIPSRRDGAITYGQDFNTSNNQAAISVPSDFDPGPEAWTLNMWVKAEAQPMGVLFMKGDAAAPEQRRFQIFTLPDNGRLCLQRNGETFVTNVFLPVGAWCLLGIVYDGTKVRIFVDGTERESRPWTQGPDARAAVFLGAGDASGASGFHGTLDEVWFSHTARSKEHMRLTFLSQKTVSPFMTLLPLY